MSGDRRAGPAGQRRAAAADAAGAVRAPHAAGIRESGVNLQRGPESGGRRSPSGDPALPPPGLADRPNIAAGLPPVSLSDDPNVGGAPPADSPEAALYGLHLPPRTNWSVSDSALRPVPPLFPPMAAAQSAYVCDASPSAVAARVSDCLRRRSVSAEYDGESASATGVTPDRVRFQVQLYRGGRGDAPPGKGGRDDGAPAGESSGAARPDFSSGVIVECQRIQGDVISFHRTCHAVLSSARGDSDGMDDYRGTVGAVGGSPFGFGPRFGDCKDDEGEGAPDSLPGLLQPRSDQMGLPASVVALELSLSLLQKDRLDAQVLGMESLVHLTDPCCSGREAAVTASLAVLGAPETVASDDGDYDDSRGEELMQIHEWILCLVVHRTVPSSEGGETARTGTEPMAIGFVPPSRGDAIAIGTIGTSTRGSSIGAVHTSNREAESLEDTQHLSTLRGLALRAFANALAVLAGRGGDPLRSCLQTRCKHLVAAELLSALVEDLGGATRPPSAALAGGARFGSPHDAALAARCLRLLAGHSPAARETVRNRPGAIGALERARLAGRAQHVCLEREADAAYAVLAEKHLSAEEYLNLSY